MQYILLIMFFVTAPNAIKDVEKNTSKDKRSWTLQSTATIEVATQDWCKHIADTISSDQNTTNTITTRAYCIPKDQKDLAVSKDEKSNNITIQGLNALDPKARQREISRMLQVAPVK